MGYVHLPCEGAGDACAVVDVDGYGDESGAVSIRLDGTYDFVGFLGWRLAVTEDVSEAVGRVGIDGEGVALYDRCVVEVLPVVCAVLADERKDGEVTWLLEVDTELMAAQFVYLSLWIATDWWVGTSFETELIVAEVDRDANPVVATDEW